jgi:AcrR family transcriptional regulator
MHVGKKTVVVAPPVLSVRAAQKELLIQRVHDAAWELFFKQGYSATTADQIAAAAGVRRATLYKYFRGKEEILRMIAERYAERLIEVAATLRGPKPSRAQIDTWIHAIADFIERERTPTVLINNIAISGESPEAMKDIAVRIIERLAQQVTAFRFALDPGPRQGRAFAWAAIVMHEISHLSLLRAREGDNEFTQNLMSVTGDLVETFFKEFK